ncbi:hypothetical protein [Granulosicoccus antarcticus]|uniref:HTH cro/C1-type domain-containing protein n=1 Tax=Granulosicoccus antarcticus IMCC3135 TaxID=1192854 RepID=A0A2Z2NXV0_9GAMM|nr:hypothetical protein [Granulosicoccus antarcticus]ASJ74811.1 hypothetical protein IMCC3135_23710 [Granulosicoccus antarcticus IMCC3135]
MTPIRSILAATAVVLLTACAGAQSQSQDSNEAVTSLKKGAARPGMPDLTEAAEKLGVTKEALQEAMSKAGGPPPDLETAAAELGVSVDALKEALPMRGRPPQ